MKKTLIAICVFFYASSQAFSQTIKLDSIDLQCEMNAKYKEFYGCTDGRIFTLSGKKPVMKVDESVIDLAANDEKELVILSSNEDGEKFLRFKDKKIKIDSEINKIYIHRSYIVLVSVASEVILLDKNTFEVVKKIHFNTASITASVQDYSYLVLGFESGEVALMDLNTLGYEIKELHKDTVYSVDLENNRVLSCSANRSVVLSDFRLSEIAKYKSDSLVYFCTISKNGTIAYACENGICIIKDGQFAGVVDTQNLYINSIYFNDETLEFNAYENKFYYKGF